MADAPIPDDIMQEAGMLLAERYTDEDEMCEAIARALQAATERERQRCAEVIQNHSIVYGASNFLGPRREGDINGLEYVAAILAGGSNGK